MQPKQSHPAAFFLWRLGERQILARLGHWVVVQDARRGFATENGGTCESRTQLFQPFAGRSTYDLKVWRPESHEARNLDRETFWLARGPQEEKACRPVGAAPIRNWKVRWGLSWIQEIIAPPKLGCQSQRIQRIVESEVQMITTTWRCWALTNLSLALYICVFFITWVLTWVPGVTRGLLRLQRITSSSFSTTTRSGVHRVAVFKNGWIQRVSLAGWDHSTWHLPNAALPLGGVSFIA